MPCARKSAPPIFFASRLEHVDEQAADGLALGLRVADAVERAEEQVAAPRRGRAGCCSGRGTGVTTSSASPCAHQAVIDEDAGELVADRLVDQHRGDGRIDAAGQPADHPALADLRADLRDRLLAEGAPSSSRRSSPRSCARSCGSAARRRACAPPRGGTARRSSCALSSADHREGRVLASRQRP